MLAATDTQIFHPLIRATAQSLLTNLGQRALPASQVAIGRMRSLGDEQGLTIWLELHAALTLLTGSRRPAGRVH